MESKVPQKPLQFMDIPGVCLIFSYGHVDHAYQFSANSIHLRGFWGTLKESKGSFLQTKTILLHMGSKKIC